MAGDLPDLTMPLQRYNAPALGASLGAGPASLLGPRGASLVIYASEDDGVSDPEGNAGARIGCGVITTAAQIAGPEVTLGPAVIIGGILQENPFYVPPNEFLRELREREWDACAVAG